MLKNIKKLHISKFVSLLVFVVSFNTIAQNSKNIENYTFDELSDKYYEYKFTDSLKAKKFANFYFNKAVKEKDTVQAIDGKSYLSEVYNNDNIYLSFIDSLITLTKKKPNNMFPAYLYACKGTYYILKSIDNKSLKNYLLALEYINSSKNDSLKYHIKQRIAMLASRNRDYKKAKDIYITIFNFYKKKPELSNFNFNCTLLLNISKEYISLKKNDSAIYFAKEAYKIAKKNNHLKYISYCHYRIGEIEYYQEKYLSAIKNLKKSLPNIIKDENFNILSNSYNYIAKSYFKLKNNKKSLKYNLLIDSLYTKTKITHLSQKYSYEYLANYYKEKKDLKNQLKYINKYLKVDSILNVRNKNLSKTFTEEYDRPKLIAEKQKIISELSNEVSFYKKSRIVIALILILSFILFLYQFRKRKKQEQKFDKLTLKLKNKKVVDNSVNSNTNVQKTLPETIITELLAKLDSFEKQPENFTNNKLTLSILAKELETNSNYLSKVINQKKGCNFSTYLRKLRIDYALDLLEKDATIRKFSIDAIAKEVGFKNAETFSKAFFKETELNPSFYIKQLEKKK
ncbi:AraC family transcriptional regulator [Polaribacter sp. BM10]|uniref:helix-turn-helix domain-containing protein n=1 Tax=Polaribacter sp. BM10 TaxID=1529069 RepID=UPI0011EA53C0|nr:helix-turn-helix domain-containing protein [Polaribacter sp. BM10]